jgi:hypothetical protein
MEASNADSWSRRSGSRVGEEEGRAVRAAKANPRSAKRVPMRKRDMSQWSIHIVYIITPQSSVIRVELWTLHRHKRVKKTTNDPRYSTGIVQS